MGCPSALPSTEMLASTPGSDPSAARIGGRPGVSAWAMAGTAPKFARSTARNAKARNGMGTSRGRLILGPSCGRVPDRPHGRDARGGRGRGRSRGEGGPQGFSTETVVDCGGGLAVTAWVAPRALPVATLSRPRAAPDAAGHPMGVIVREQRLDLDLDTDDQGCQEGLVDGHSSRRGWDRSSTSRRARSRAPASGWGRCCPDRLSCPARTDRTGRLASVARCLRSGPQHRRGSRTC